MNELLARAGAMFVAPASAAAPRPAVAARPPDLIGVLAGPADLAVVAGGVTAAARARHGTRTALVVLPAELVIPRCGTRAARGLAQRLVDRDVPAVAAGSVCHAGLPPDAAEHDAWRAIAAAAGLPAVLALPARTEALDPLLAQADELLLAPATGAQAELIALALASLAALGPPAALVPAPSGLIGRRTAAYGLRRLQPPVPATERGG